MARLKLSPIILFVYNRPEHTRKTMEALMKNELASESILYVFADGAKEMTIHKRQKKNPQNKSAGIH